MTSGVQSHESKNMFTRAKCVESAISFQLARIKSHFRRMKRVKYYYKMKRIEVLLQSVPYMNFNFVGSRAGELGALVLLLGAPVTLLFLSVSAPNTARIKLLRYT